MRTVSIIVMLCGICLPCAGAHGADWVRYFSDKVGNEWFYDRSSMGSPSKGIVDVWGKGVYSKDGIHQELAERKKAKLPAQGFSELSYLVERFEVNCRKNEFYVYERVFSTKEGKILHSYTSPKKRGHWYAINPESKMGALHASVCKLQGKEPNKITW